MVSHPLIPLQPVHHDLHVPLWSTLDTPVTSDEPVAHLSEHGDVRPQYPDCPFKEGGLLPNLH